MKLRITHVLLGFAVTFVALLALDFVLYNFFLTDGYINNSIVGLVLSFQLTEFQRFWFGVAILAVAASLVAKDFARRRPYKLTGNERTVGTSVGIVLATLVLFLPWLKPNEYQLLLGTIIVVITLLCLRRTLLARK